jgi:hypothetical protein
MRRVVAAVTLAILAAVPAAAQRTTGTIFGTVTDQSGAVLPGVTVTLRSTAVPGAPTAVTSETGVYRFPALPPGSYDLEYELTGFGTVRRPGITVSVGGTSELNVTMGVSTVEESVTVTGQAPVVDAASTHVSTNYNRDWVENAPVRRFSMFDLVNSAPGVSQAQTTGTTQPATSLGSSVNDNSWQLDGSDFTAAVSGNAWPWPNTDAIQEVEVMQLGAPAEYGGIQGAVFNVVTRQGSNQFHGDGNFYWSHQNLTSRNTTDEQDSGLPFNHARFRDFTAQYGGPFLKDKLWFFASYQFQNDWYSQPGTDPEAPTRSNAKRMFYKFNYQINPSQSLMHAYHDDYWEFPGNTTALTAPSSVTNYFGDNPSPNFVYTNVLTDKTLLEARYSGFYARDAALPTLDGEPKVKTRFYDLDTGIVTGGIYSWADDRSGVTQVAGKLSHFADNFMGGSHDVKLGVQYRRGGNDYIIGRNDYIYTYSGVPSFGYTQLPYHQGGMMDDIAVYADDTYRLGERTTLNLGLRYDHTKSWFESFDLLNAAGQPTGQKSQGVDKLYAWDTVSPRAGVSFKLDSQGRTLVKAHFGRYYRAAITGEFDAATPSISPLNYFEFDARGNRTAFDEVSSNRNLRVDSEIKPPRTDQLSLQFEHELIRNLGLQVTYAHKRGDDQTGWEDIAGVYVPVNYVDNVGREASGQTFVLQRLVSPASDRVFQLTTPGERNLAHRMYNRYNGVVIQAQKRMANNWQGTFSLVLSKSEGRGGSNKSTPVTAPSAIPQVVSGVTFGQNPNDYVNTDGLIIGDRPVVAKVQLVYNFPYDITVAANFQHQTGRLWSRQIRPSGLGFPATPVINMEANTGDRRVADMDLFDLRIQKAIRLGSGSTNLALFADVLNLTNSDANESIGDRLGTSANFGLPVRFVFPRRAQIGAKIRF